MKPLPDHRLRGAAPWMGLLLGALLVACQQSYSRRASSPQAFELHRAEFDRDPGGPEAHSELWGMASAAFRNSNAQQLRETLQRGLDPNATFMFGMPMLGVAADHGESSFIPVLLDFGASLQGTGENGLTPLMVAAQKGHGLFLRALAERGADLEAREESGRTALILAAEEREPVSVTELLLLGADPNAIDARGRSPLMALATALPQAIFDVFLADVQERDLTRAESEYLGIAIGLLAAGAREDLVASNGRTAADELRSLQLSLVVGERVVAKEELSMYVRFLELLEQ